MSADLCRPAGDDRGLPKSTPSRATTNGAGDSRRRADCVRRHALPRRKRQSLICPTGQDLARKIFLFFRNANQANMGLSHPTKGAARDRHERAVGCGGRGTCERRVHVKRTAKSCGSGAPMLALSRADEFRHGDGGKKAVHRGERDISRKTTAQGRPGCLRRTCMLVCAFFCATCTRDRGCGVHPVFPAPSVLDEGELDANLGRNAPRERGRTSGIRNDGGGR
jgi:hypothetical protein